MIDFKKAKDYIRQELKSHYGKNLLELKGRQKLAHLHENLVMDATLDSEKNFHISVYINTRDLIDDEPVELYESA